MGAAAAAGGGGGDGGGGVGRWLKWLWLVTLK